MVNKMTHNYYIIRPVNTPIHRYSIQHTISLFSPYESNALSECWCLVAMICKTVEIPLILCKTRSRYGLGSRVPDTEAESVGWVRYEARSRNRDLFLSWDH